MKSIITCPAHEQSGTGSKRPGVQSPVLFKETGDRDRIGGQHRGSCICARKMCQRPPDDLRGSDEFPDGSRVFVESPPTNLRVAQQRAMVCDEVAKSVGRTLTVRSRPLSMKLSSDSFAKAIVSMTVKAIAASAKFKSYINPSHGGQDPVRTFPNVKF